jgi:hypothetical protein
MKESEEPDSCEEDNGVDFKHQHEHQHENETSGEVAEAGRAL